MATLWGLHNDEPSLDLVAGSFVSIGWDEIGDLRAYDNKLDELKASLSNSYPTAKPGAIPCGPGC